MQRIHNTIRDLQAYEAQKLIESTTEKFEPIVENDFREVKVEQIGRAHV